MANLNTRFMLSKKKRGKEKKMLNEKKHGRYLESRQVTIRDTDRQARRPLVMFSALRTCLSISSLPRI